MIGVTFVDSFLNREQPEAASLDDVLNHIDYMVRLVGAEHVALGSDFDGWTLARELRDATCYPLITAGLLERGHQPHTIRQILGENYLRVMTMVLGRDS